MATVSFSIPVLSIPFYYMLAIFPHGYATTRANRGDMKKHDNRNPNGSSNIESLRKRISPKEWAAYERGEACHRNNLENMPLYVATVFAGILAESRAGESELGLISFVLGWNIVRILYTVNYLTTETIAWSYVRSLLYFVGLGWSFLILYRSAVVLGN